MAIYKCWRARLRQRTDGAIFKKWNVTWVQPTIHLYWLKGMEREKDCSTLDMVFAFATGFMERATVRFKEEAGSRSTPCTPSWLILSEIRKGQNDKNYTDMRAETTQEAFQKSSEGHDGERERDLGIHAKISSSGSCGRWSLTNVMSVYYDSVSFRDD